MKSIWMFSGHKNLYTNVGVILNPVSYLLNKCVFREIFDLIHKNEICTLPAGQFSSSELSPQLLSPSHLNFRGMLYPGH